MESLKLKNKEISDLKKLVIKMENYNGKDVYFVPPVFNSSCDKYDCFFGSVKCTCQGICDGRN